MNVIEVKRLDNKIYAMLTSEQNTIFDYFEARGRKYGVSISIVDGANENNFATANSLHQVNEFQRRTNGRVSVRFETNVAWQGCDG